MGSIVLTYSPNMSDHCCGLRLIGPSVTVSLQDIVVWDTFPRYSLAESFSVHKPGVEQRPQHRTSLKRGVLCRGALRLSWEVTSASSDVPSRWSMKRHAGADCCIYRKSIFLTGLSSGIWTLTVLFHFKFICTWWSVWGWFPPQWKLIKGL